MPAGGVVDQGCHAHSRRGVAGLAQLLNALAADLDDRSRTVREVEAERAKPRANMRIIVVARTGW